MTQSREPNERDILTRIATLEYQMREIQNVQAQLRATIAPGGYITDAFERVVNRIDEVESRLQSQIEEVKAQSKSQHDEVNGKIDIIIRRLSGMSNL